jgi:branched-chain amino acid transport system permease protein
MRDRFRAIDAAARRRARVPLASAFGVGAFAVALLLAPSVGFEGDIPLLVNILAILVFAYAWNPVGGMLGELSLAHLVFWGGGGYVLIMASNAGWPLLQTLAAAALLGAALAAALVLFAFAGKLEGLYLLVFGLVFIHFADAVAANWHAIGALEGLSAMVLPLTVDQLYYVLVGLATALILLNIVLLNSRRGLVWLAIRDDPSRVGSLGWSIKRERFIVYVGTGALCGIGGALHIASLGFVSPDAAFEIGLIVIVLLAVYVGGPGRIWGPLLGVALLEGLSTIASSGSTSTDSAQKARLLQYVVALVLVAFLMHRQRGRRPAILSGRGGGAAAERGTPAPLTVEGLGKSFGGLRVLEDVSFDVGPGEILGLVGPNGAGKSTICGLIAGDIRPDRGTIRFGTERANGMAPFARTRAGLGRTYQTPKVFGGLTLAENVAIAGSALGTADASALLETFGIADPYKRGDSATLAERRIVEMVRLRALGPKWVLLDEPLAGLAAEEHERVLELVRDIAGRGTSVLLIEHLVPVIAPITDRIVVLDGGRLIASGPPEQVLRDPAVVDAYLGQPLTLEVGAGT